MGYQQKSISYQPQFQQKQMTLIKQTLDFIKEHHINCKRNINYQNIQNIMIHKSRKLLSHCLAPIPRKLRFYFALGNQSNEQLRILQGKAYLSDKIIKQIINPQVNIQQKSLRQHLVDMIDSTNEVPQPSRDFIKSMFTTGIPVDLDTFDQGRIQSGINPIPSERKLFTFCPTRLVTSQMFEALRNQQLNTLFMGHYGISKSVSVMFYSILSNLIAQYKFKTFKTLAGSSQGLAVMIGDSPKVIYANMTACSFAVEEFKQLIYNQLKAEIKEQQFQKFFNDNPFDIKGKRLRTYYKKKGVKIILMFDQISSIVALLRDSNSSNFEDLKQKRNLRLQSFKYFIQCLTPEFNTIHYLSSITIQKQLLPNFKIFGHQDGHQPLRILEIKYLQNLLIKDAAKEIIDLFMFELQRIFQIKILLQNKQIPLQQVPQKFKKYATVKDSHASLNTLIRNYLSQKLIESSGYILTFFSIRLSLQKAKKQGQSKNDFDNLKDFESIQKLESLLSDAILFSHKEVQQSLNKFFLKQQAHNKLTNQIKHNLIFSLYQSASFFEGQADNKSLYKINIEPHYSRIRKQNVQKYIDKNLFRFDNNELKTLIPPKLLMFILQPYIESTIAYMLKFWFRQMKMYFTSSMLGQYSELTFARMISEILPQLHFIFFEKKTDLKFKISNAQLLVLQPIPSQIPQGYQFLKSTKRYLASKIDDLKRQKDTKRQSTIKKDYFFITNKNFVMNNSPQFDNTVTKDAIKNNNNKGRAIDCAILTIQIDNNEKVKLNLTALQLTVGDESATSKINRFIKAFNKFSQKHDSVITHNETEIKISLDFLVICSEQKEQKILKKQLEINKESNLVFYQITDEKCKLVGIKHFNDEKKRPSLLKRVGYVTIGDRLVVKSENEREIQDQFSPIGRWRLLEKIVGGKI